MSVKNCSACTKMVYPMEQLKCLDKIWHKACFRCQVCSMTLNMKNYKGYNKLPYCNAHYPTTKFTAVADTPENMRIKKNTQAQSNIQYHAQFEKSKGQYTSVADDPETLRVKKNMQTISNVAYHGELMKRQEMENARPTEIEADGTAAVQPAPRRVGPGSISDYEPTDSKSPYSSKTQSTTVYSSAAANSQRQEPKQDEGPASQPPVTSQPAPVFAEPEPSPLQHLVREPSPPPPAEPEPEPIPEPTPEPIPEPTPEPVKRELTPPVPEPAPAPEPEAPSADASAGKGKVSKAMYDYAAGDDDEVSFNEDDLIINCEPIDEGWMTGTVERTGQTGMLPSNYVEPVNW